MKNLIFALILIAACTSRPIEAPQTISVLDIEDQTVAIYHLEADVARCTGVWVGPYRILTAAHCADSDPQNPVFYTVADEYQGVFRHPKKVHSMQLVREDKEHDLALYRTGAFDTPTHISATLAPQNPTVGSALFFTGNSAGLNWSYRQGWVSSYREVDVRPFLEKKGPWMQVSAPMYLGDSGGGAFNGRGELVGIASLLVDPIPNAAFYVYLPTIREFLK